ncbi:MAG: hypothetical protein KME42_13960 [Tildeniella nuda ZEHNDER 1965/U140]|jgi:hypothetical protein|nr:hypothetical protein [Tildeniella nuda ZEHNDER 1965/U140]
MTLQEVLAGTVGLVLLVGCKSIPQPQSSTPQALKGEIAVLFESKSDSAWRLRHVKDAPAVQQCDGSSASVSNGAAIGKQIRLKNGAGNLIAAGALSNGEVQKISSSGACVFSFAMQPIPAADFYTIEIDPYGSLSFSKLDLVAKQWTLGITVDLTAQTLSDNLAAVREETIAKRKEYDAADRLIASLENATSKIAENEEKTNREYKERLYCINEQKLANFNDVDKEVLSNECRKFLAKTGALNELVKGASGELKYRTELDPPKPKVKP